MYSIIIYEMPKAKYTPEERKRIQKENLLKNKQKCDRTNYSRLEAIEQGRKTYQVKKPCKRCGSFERYVSTKGCVPCSIERGLEKLNNEELMKPYRTKEKINNKTYRYRSKKNNGISELTKEENNRIEEIYKECARITEETGILHHVDHIHPISKGGRHHPDNLQILTAVENISKSNKLL